MTHKVADISLNFYENHDATGRIYNSYSNGPTFIAFLRFPLSNLDSKINVLSFGKDYASGFWLSNGNSIPESLVIL